MPIKRQEQSITMPAINFRRQVPARRWENIFNSHHNPGRVDVLDHLLQMRKLRFQTKRAHVQGPNTMNWEEVEPLDG